MAIIKRKNGNYQVKVRGTDGKWLTKTFPTKGEAQAFQTNANQQRNQGAFLTSSVNRVNVDQFFEQWFQALEHQASPGWRRCQRQFYQAYIRPILGEIKMKSVTPILIARVLNQVAGLGKSEQTQRHIFNLMRKMFGDAIELFRILTYNPVLITLKPIVPVKETKHLNLSQVKELLDYVQNKEYGLAIWIQIYLGLRVSEVIALKWSDIDLESGLITIARSYSRKDSWVKKETVINDHPKGRRHHTHSIPPELTERLWIAKAIAKSDFVAVASFNNEMLSYEYYLETLKRYCNELEISEVGTHGLRHSTSELYIHHGASEGDLMKLFAHSSMEITKRYLHGKHGNLEKVAQKIKLFPGCSQNVPKSEFGNCA